MNQLTNTIITKIKASLPKIRMQEKADITPYTTMHMKATTDLLVELTTREDLIVLLQILSSEKIAYKIFGGGSNVAIIQDNVPLILIRNMFQQIQFISEDDDSADIIVSSGYPMARLVVETSAKGLSGFEYHLGLPGTVGGALYMNSKWTKPITFIGDSLVKAWIIDTEGKEKVVNKDYFRFAYDYSYLQETKEVVIEAQFKLIKEKPEILQQRAHDALAYRKASQPMGVATSGCYFQNISEEEAEKAKVPTKSAGYLIDHAGLKGYRVGGFSVSAMHANFIINDGNGDPKDLRMIIAHIKKTVSDRYGIILKTEVEEV